MAEQEGDGFRSLVPAVARAVAILDVLAQEPGASVQIGELSRRLGLPRSSVGNLCRELAKHNLLEEFDSGFGLGRRLAEFGAVYLRGVDEVRAFTSVASELGAGEDDTLQLATISSDLRSVIYLARHDGSNLIRLVSDIGVRMGSTTTATGKAMLAQFEDRVVEAALSEEQHFPRNTINSITTMEQLNADLSLTRQRGYAVDDEETTLGVYCVAVTIPVKPVGSLPHSISFTMLKATINTVRVRRVVSRLRQLAENIGERLGGRGGEHAPVAVAAERKN